MQVEKHVLYKHNAQVYPQLQQNGWAHDFDDVIKQLCCPSI